MQTRNGTSLPLGISAAQGNTLNTEAPANLPGREVLGDRADRSIFNVFSAYKRHKWTLQSEYMQAHSQLLGVTGLPPAPGPVTINPRIGRYADQCADALTR